MRAYYVETNLADTASQLSICSINEAAVPVIREQRLFAKAFPSIWRTGEQFLNPDQHMNVLLAQFPESERDEEIKKVDPAKMGDVIWVQVGKDILLGLCVVCKGDTTEVYLPAVEACMKSVQEKAKQADTEYVGMGMFASDTVEEWNNVRSIIETELGPITPVVCVPDNSTLSSILDSLDNVVSLNLNTESG